MANFSQAFILSSITARMAQALQINLEYSTDLLNDAETAVSVVLRESRRRLMWSCYVTDSHCGSGVDQLTLIDEKDLKIQLPCRDADFIHERFTATRTLSGLALSFLPPNLSLTEQHLDENMGIVAYYIQHISIRRRVLKYIKHLDRAKLPWLIDSEFHFLEAELWNWYENLPSMMKFTPETIYIRKESSQLGALCVLHCAFHQSLCDLYRLGVPALYNLRSAFHFPPEQLEFRKRLQWSLFTAARTLATIITEGGQHGPSIISDTWLPTIAYDSIRIMLYYLSQINEPPPGQSKRGVMITTLSSLKGILRAMNTMRATNAHADTLVSTWERKIVTVNS